MKHSDLSNFTHGELSAFKNYQITLGKLELLDLIATNKINIPDELSEKLFLLCKDSIQLYEDISGHSCDFVQPIGQLSIKDKLECAKNIVLIIEKVIHNDDMRNLGLSLINKLFDIFN
jgi:hypothetical protein